jgi:hypothetical protein
MLFSSTLDTDRILGARYSSLSLCLNIDSWETLLLIDIEVEKLDLT